MTVFKAVCLTGKNQLKTDGTANIKIRLTHNRKVAYISTDLYVPKNNFDNKAGQATGGGNADHINISLSQTLLDYRKKDLQLGSARQFMTVAEIKKHLLSGVVGNTVIDFYTFAAELIEQTQNAGTVKSYVSTLESLKNFKQKQLLTSEINLNFLYRYERWLRERNVGNGVVNYMKTFRAMFNKARDLYNNEDTGQIAIPNYPFRKYKMPKRQTGSNNHVLTVEEIRALIPYQPEKQAQQYAKDMFLLMFYLIGAETKDLFYLQKPQNGRVWYTRFKTGGDFSVKLEPEALEIINRYAGADALINAGERFASHISFYRSINDNLHGRKPRKKQPPIEGLFNKTGIYKPVTTKWARHTWATIARNECGISKDDVALCLGHKDQHNRVTDVYIKYDYSIIDRTNRKVLDYINEVCKCGNSNNN